MGELVLDEICTFFITSRIVAGSEKKCAEFVSYFWTYFGFQLGIEPF